MTQEKQFCVPVQADTLIAIRELFPASTANTISHRGCSEGQWSADQQASSEQVGQASNNFCCVRSLKFGGLLL